MVRGGNYQIQKLFGTMSQYLRGKFFVVCGALTLLEVYLPEAEVGFQGYCRKGRRKSPPKIFACSALLLDQCREVRGRHDQ